MSYNGVFPHCKAVYDARCSDVVFSLEIKNVHVDLIFAVCPVCFIEFNRSRDPKGFSKICIENVFADRSIDWTVTSSLAFAAHSGHFLDSWWVGIEIPKTLFQMVYHGVVDSVSFLPGGVRW